MELAQEKIELIKKIIKSDKKYVNNEDLFDDFFNESYRRSFLIIKTVENQNSLEAYLRKIVTTSILTVLKDLGRLRRTSEGFVPTKEQSIDHVQQQITEQVKSTVASASDNKYSNVKISYDLVDLNDGPEEIVIKKETLQTLIDAVSVAHSKNPAKQYMQLYELRYVKGMKQAQIAKELNLSQSEVSKRLLELMEQVKEAFNQV